MKFQRKKLFYETILHLACKSGNYDLVKYLISLKDIDVNAKDDIFFYNFFMTFLFCNHSWNFK